MLCRKEATELYNNIGYCPQYDYYMENMTIREHISMMAAIRGTKEIKVAVQRIAAQV